ncbi:SusC/RagA family TonB-linked outer membrane protein [Hufsiella ginkgonis]|uniref:SusC/RagA family TonB-linked outer membrane protein n=1 Tax=Hufsiella ginkgonis TaxID=2695274 RepID=A0A7K1Y1B5_9SPHI|nr:TonB-dependent receptor [Hufsiella ginkgonis]MXV17033.1 SusC/RagA family TonB-linked outer membrane protein [Hufsiella ginkgonis]
MKQKLLIFFLSLFTVAQAVAQTRTVTGTVTGNDDGGPIPGVSVRVKGTQVAVQTNASGVYSIRLADNQNVITFTSIGYKTHDETIGNRTTVNVGLTPDVSNLNEVVITGYGVEQKRDIAGAVSRVTGAEIENMPVASFDRAIQGKMSGVLVQGSSGIPGGNVQMRIRGSGSINAGNDPLYIVDGVQMQGGDISRSLTSANLLNAINPNDIESIDVLKDAASAAIYGSQAANGVVIITTKRGKSGKTKLTLNYQTGGTDMINKTPVTNGPQFLELMYEARRNLLLAQGLNATQATQVADARSTSLYGFVPSTFGNAPTYDWQEAMTRRGNTNLIEGNANGGNESTQFYLSGSYQKLNGQIIKSDFSRGTMHLNLNHKASSRLSFDTKLNLSTITQNAVESSNQSGSLFLSGVTIPSIQPIYNPDGTYAEPVLGTRPSNVIKQTNYNKNLGVTNQLTGSVGADFEIVSGLKFRSAWNLDYTDIVEDRYIDPRTRDGAAFGGQANELNTRRANWSTDQVFNYIKKFNEDNNLTALLGFSYRNVVDNTITAQGRSFPNELFQTLQSAATPFGVNSSFTTYRTAGYFTKVNYTYKGRYIINSTLRYDGSSRFGADKKYGWFPSVSLAWRLSDESFVKKIDAISELKLRGSYGITGNQQIGNFDSRSLFQGNAASAYNGIGGITPTGLGNAVLSWEENHSIDLGLDFAFFNSRLAGTFDAFRRTSKDLLLDRPLPSTSGFTTISQNIGSVKNEGLELELTTQNITSKAFKWSTNFNWTLIRSRVLKLNEGLDRIISSNAFVGKPLGSIYVVEFAGVNAATGRPFWYDANNNITYQPSESAGVNDARRIIGKSVPDSYGGIGNTFSYKGVDLNVFFQGQFGNTLINNNSFFGERSGSSETNHTMRVYDRRWRQPGDITDWPKMYNSTEPLNRGLASFSSRNYESGAYIRLKTVTLSYSLPASWLTKAKMRSVRINLEAYNLLTFTGYTGYDPEVTGSDLGVFPQGKTLTAGIQVGF